MLRIFSVLEVKTPELVKDSGGEDSEPRLSKCNKNTAEIQNKHQLDLSTRGRARWQDTEQDNTWWGEEQRHAGKTLRNYRHCRLHSCPENIGQYGNISQYECKFLRMTWCCHLWCEVGRLSLTDHLLGNMSAYYLQHICIEITHKHIWGVDVFTGACVSSCRTGCTVRLLYKYKRLRVRWQRPTAQ